MTKEKVGYSREAMIKFLKIEGVYVIGTTEEFSGQEGGIWVGGEEMDDLFEYYNNNLIESFSLLEVMKKFGINKIIFSSTAETPTFDALLPLMNSLKTKKFSNGNKLIASKMEMVNIYMLLIEHMLFEIKTVKQKESLDQYKTLRKKL